MNFFTLTKFGRILLTAVICTGLLFVCGTNTFTDSRDGQKYKTVKIGNQVWMAENLRFNVGDSWCYDNNDENCNKYGRLYDWDAAEVACPKGWHLPHLEEWKELVTVVSSKTGGKKLKSTSGWKKRTDGSSGDGTDDFGFSALPGGARRDDDRFVSVGALGYWWMGGWCEESRSGWPFRGHCQQEMSYKNDDVQKRMYNDEGGYSVRCIAKN